jgi:hypothetical protein
MPFGLTGAPARFCWLMSDVLHPKFVAVYIDDILLIYLEDALTHQEHIHAVLKIPKGECLTVNSTKC